MEKNITIPYSEYESLRGLAEANNEELDRKLKERTEEFMNVIERVLDARFEQVKTAGSELAKANAEIGSLRNEIARMKIRIERRDNLIASLKSDIEMIYDRSLFDRIANVRF